MCLSHSSEILFEVSSSSYSNKSWTVIRTAIDINASSSVTVSQYPQTNPIRQSSSSCRSFFSHNFQVIDLCSLAVSKVWYHRTRFCLSFYVWRLVSRLNLFPGSVIWCHCLVTFSTLGWIRSQLVLLLDSTSSCGPNSDERVEVLCLRHALPSLLPQLSRLLISFLIADGFRKIFSVNRFDVIFLK